jgi:hypothetical protein
MPDRTGALGFWRDVLSDIRIVSSSATNSIRRRAGAPALTVSR